MNFILIEGKISPKVTRARGQAINSQKVMQLVLHLWMYQQSVNHGRILHCPKRVLP